MPIPDWADSRCIHCHRPIRDNGIEWVDEDEQASCPSSRTGFHKQAEPETR